MIQTMTTPQAFGAAGDGVTDDTLAVQKAFNSGLPVSLVGRFLITGPVNVTLDQTNNGLMVAGAGRGMSQIVLGGETANVIVSIADAASPWGKAEQVVLKDFCFVPTVVVSGHALTINAPIAIGSAETTFYIENVHIIPSTTMTYVENGFLFNNCRNSTMSSCTLCGFYGAFLGNGITWTGGGASGPVDFHMRDCEPTWWGNGLFLQGNTAGITTGGNDWQGIYVTGCTFIGTDYGIYAQTIDGFGDLITVSNTHFNYRTRGIYAVNVRHVFVTNVFGLANGGAPSNTTICIDLSWTDDIPHETFLANIFVDFESVMTLVGTRIGVRVSSYDFTWPKITNLAVYAGMQDTDITSVFARLWYQAGVLAGKVGTAVSGWASGLYTKVTSFI